MEPETGATVLQYDAAGNLLWSAAGLALPSTSSSLCESDRAVAYTSGRRVDRAYDTRNRLVQLTFPDGNGDQVLTYTADGLPATVETKNDAGGTTLMNTYSYNRLRLLKAETTGYAGWFTWTLDYSYTPSGHLASHTYPNGLVVAYAPNALGQPTQAGTWATGVQYHPSGAVKSFTYGNGRTHSLTLNARGLPLRINDNGGTLRQDHVYDANGNVTQIIDGLAATRTRTMTYDPLDRLLTATSPSFGGDHWHRFSYDAFDNLRSWTLAGVKDYASYEYDANNRLQRIRATGGAVLRNFAHDVQGNLRWTDGQEYEFDFGNRLRSVTGVEYYRYDALGRRALVYRPPTVEYPTGHTTLWMYSRAGQPILSHRGDHVPTTHANIYLGSRIVATVEAVASTGTVIKSLYQHTDALGSPVAVTNTAGAVVDRTVYDPYGGAVGDVVDGLGYTGHVEDGRTSLVYMQQRYYDAGIAGFLSVDPYGVAQESGRNFGRFKYAANNPFTFTDPDGRREAADRFGDQFKADAEAGNISDYDSFRVPALVVTAAMLVGPPALFLMPEAGGLATADSWVAINAARSAASAAEAAGATSGATSGLALPTGQVFTGASTNAGGAGFATNPIVQRALDSIAPALRSCYHGQCGEVGALSNALNAGARVEGGVMATVRTVGKDILDGCPTCQRLADRLGVRLVETPPP
ncbi:RHS repeat-associated core domain-containing protein [Arenimonas composti]|uniref:Teneurin-like YD-shell domain-containing protein n=1 Tax=Arenimonas composti TR7-09 = DSM 18010 TaxID=1121013 RepID=A0A091BDP6_9GAMM|nr:RHS repeat-associated core domain-containing protein [Arenimonas composti]KFN49652.1 hypothetical protein P873_09805 [Arenimonas composti TR7-09 = DSM 18010]